MTSPERRLHLFPTRSPQQLRRIACTDLAESLPPPQLLITIDNGLVPFPDSRFDTIVCADNSLPHLPAEQEVHAALAGMRRVLRPDACC